MKQKQMREGYEEESEHGRATNGVPRVLFKKKPRISVTEEQSK